MVTSAWLKSINFRKSGNMASPQPQNSPPMVDIGLTIENARLRQQVLLEREKTLKVETQLRKEIANQLHDGPTQLLSAMMMHLELCSQLLEKNPTLVAEEIGAMKNLVAQTEYDLRTMLLQLRPIALEMNGLDAALEYLVGQLRKNPNAPQLKLEIKNEHLNGQISRQNKQTEQVLFRIAQETVNNALKHAKATTITIQLQETAHHLCLTIKDDGQGFNVNEVLHHYSKRTSLGLLNIQEQVELIGGQLAIESVLGEGTTISIIVRSK